MKKLIVILIITALIIFAGCETVSEVAIAVLEEIVESESSQQVEEVPELVVDNNADEDKPNGAIESDYRGPLLPKLDFDNLDFFRDGYEVVSYSRTTDGDTASFIMDGDNIKCRFVGVNTPELDHDGGNHEPYAMDAKDFTQKLLEGANTIILERDENAGEHDNYDRLLAHVWVNGMLLNYYLVFEGLATTRYMRDYYSHADDIFAAEEMAQDAGRGVWGN